MLRTINDKYVELTGPDGTKVWLCKSWITKLTPPIPASNYPPGTRSVVYQAQLVQACRESPEDILAELN